MRGEKSKEGKGGMRKKPNDEEWLESKNKRKKVKYKKRRMSRNRNDVH
jgi:hypothetical protein